MSDDPRYRRITKDPRWLPPVQKPPTIKVARRHPDCVLVHPHRGECVGVDGRRLTFDAL